MRDDATSMAMPCMVVVSEGEFRPTWPEPTTAGANRTLASVPYMTVFKRKKGVWWMPWHIEAMKDVARCDKPRLAVSRL
jgi:hypothetical protein